METNILDFFERGALRSSPDKIGFADPEDSFTFREIERRAKAVAAGIIRQLDTRNRPIAVCLPKCAKALICDLGILYSGNFYMNLDDQAPAPRTQAVLGNVDPALVITRRSQADDLAALDFPADRLLFVEDFFGAAAAPPPPEDLAPRRELTIDTDPVCIINTSGSTGIPKSVVLSHRGLIDFINWWDRRFEFDDREIVGSLSPFFFDGYIVGFLMTLFKGARLEVVPGELAVFPARLVEYLAEKRISFIFWVPSIMVTIASFKLFDKRSLPDLRTVCFAGEVFPTVHFNYWRRRLPHATFVNLYGPIEISVICTYYVVDREFRDDEPLPIGFPCRNTDILILTDDNRAAGANERGELCVRGSSLAHGYWNNQEATARAFVQNPLQPHYPEIIYRTGDVAYRNERGEIMFVGRRDFQVKHLGFRFDLGEIEHFVLQIPGIRNACVCYDAAAKAIHLFFEADGPVTPAFAREKLSANLPKHMWPRVFHRMDQLPRNPNGKIDRTRLSGSMASRSAD